MVFPTRGVHRGLPLANQPAGTCPDALNVRAYDPLRGRVRGGQRNGYAKAFTTQIANQVDLIVPIARPEGVTTGSPPSAPVFEEGLEGYFEDDLLSAQSDWVEIDNVGTAGPGTYSAGSDTVVKAYTTPGVDADTYGVNYAKMQVVSTGSSHIRANLATGASGLVATPYTLRLSLVSLTDSLDEIDYGDYDTQFSSDPEISLIIRCASDYKSCVEVYIGISGAQLSIRIYEWNSGSSEVGSAVFVADPGTTPRLLEVDDDGSTLTIRIDGTEVRTETTSHNSSETIVGFGYREKNSLSSRSILNFDNFAILNQIRAPFGRLDTRLVIFGDEKIYRGDLPVDIGSALTQISDDGLGGNDQTGLKANSAVAAVMYGSATDTLGDLSGTYCIYAVDGVSKRVINPFSDTATERVFDWEDLAGDASGVNDTTTNEANLNAIDPYVICGWRGRILLAGDVNDQNNVYASRLAFPYDFEYATENTNGGLAESAWALDNSDIGRNPDIVMALVPYDDDTLIIGGGQSVRVLRGDVTVGGQNDKITEHASFLGPRAWTSDRAGNIYFLGRDGLFRLNAKSGELAPLSDTVLDDLLKSIDHNDNFVHLAYDYREDEVRVFITPMDQETEHTHVVFDTRQKGFWLDRFPTSHGPTCAASVYANDPAHRFLFMGGFNGYVYLWDESTKDDDDTAINSYVEYSQVHAAGDLLEADLIEQHAVVGVNSDGISWAVRTAKDAESLFDDESVRTISGTIATGGFQRPIRTRVRGAVMQLKLSNSNAGESWSMERWVFFVKAGSRRR